MGQLLAGNYSGPAFQLFGIAHISALAVLCALSIFLVRFREASASTKQTIRWTLALILWTSEISWHIWNVYWGYWSIEFMLPLNVCSVLIWLSGFMLTFKNYRIYEFTYFLGSAACANYLLTPDLGVYGFPHFRFFQTFISHGLVITAAVYMTVVEGFRPTWKSFWKVVLGTNVYMIFIYLLNILLGSNYLLLNAKPSSPSIMEFMPAW